MNRATSRTPDASRPPAPRSETVFDLLKERILGFEYLPGAPLTELGIAEELHVSRTPIREALRRLEHEQLVRIVPHKGAMVIGLAEDDVREVYLIRQALEGLRAPDCGVHQRRKSPATGRQSSRSQATSGSGPLRRSLGAGRRVAPHDP